MGLDLSRQAKLVNSENINRYFIKVFGVGSVGSHVIKILSKTGFKNIEGFDLDKVEEENIAAQAFDFNHIGMNKVDAIKDICKNGADVEITATHGPITQETIILPEANTIYCCFFDSFEGRKLVFDKVKEYPVIFVDGRIGSHNMRHYLVDCSNPDEVKDYEDTLNTKASSELECGLKACAAINVELAGRIVNNIVNYISGDDYVKTFIGNVKAPKNDILILKLREKVPRVTPIESDLVKEVEAIIN